MPSSGEQACVCELLFYIQTGLSDTHGLVDDGTTGAWHAVGPRARFRRCMGRDVSIMVPLASVVCDTVHRRPWDSTPARCVQLQNMRASGFSMLPVHCGLSSYSTR